MRLNARICNFSVGDNLMKKRIALTAGLCLLFAAAVFGQGKTNYAGDWTLDTGKSELGENSRIESATMTVTQADGELKYERKIKRKPAEDGARGGRRRGRGLGGGNQGPPVFKLDGTETSTEIDNGFITGKITRKAEEKDGKLMLTINRVFETPRGERKTSTVETWELSEDGNTLTVSSETETPRGTRSSKMVYAKA